MVLEAKNPMICGKCLKSVDSLVEHRPNCQGQRELWVNHLDAVDKGKTGRVGRLARKAFGIVGKPMSDETKAKLNDPKYKTNTEIHTAGRKMREALMKKVRASLSVSRRRRR